MENDNKQYDICPICATKKYTKAWITCPSFNCRFSCCRSCVKSFLLGNHDADPKCMSCKIGWNYDFLMKNTEANFYEKEYRDYRANIFLEREKSLLPNLLEQAARKKRDTQLEEQLKDYRKQIKELKKKIDDTNRELKNNRSAVVQEKKEKSELISHCPYDQCKGYLNSNYVCALCDKKSCKTCRQQEHENDCDKNVVETLKLLARDTKNCPNCKIPINKIDGCDQMYCVKCHTPFSWTTGKIETGRIHNPHYYEYLRKHGEIKREEGDIPCGGQVRLNELTNIFRNNGVQNFEVENTVLDSHMLSGHIRQTVLPFYQNPTPQEKYNTLRIKYLTDEIDDTKWKTDLKRFDKQKQKCQSAYLILSMFVDVVDDIHRKIVTDESNLHEYTREINEIRDYTNRELKKMFESFGNKVRQIQDWTYWHNH